MKEIRYSKDARKELLSGVEMIAKAVKTTLGPSGRNVLIRNKGENRPFSTKDGVTVAGQVSSKNPTEQVAIESLQDIANIADEGAGDGTTTATVLAEAILLEGLKEIDDRNLFDVKRGIEEAARLVVELIGENSIDVKDNSERLKEVAMISSNGDEEIASIVKDAFEIAGKQGIVNIKRSRSYDSYVKSIKGMTLPVGYISKFYATSADDTCVLEKPWVYFTDKKLNTVSDNLDYFLAQAASRGQSVLIMCNGLDPAVSEMFIRNTQQGAIRLCVTKLPGFGNEQVDLLRDLGCVLGKDPFIENEGLDFDEIAQEDLFKVVPRCKEVTISEHNTSFSEPYFEVSEELAKANDITLEELETKKKTFVREIDQAKLDRADMLREEIENTQTQYEKSVLQTRISRLSDGIAFINIGARSNTEFLEKQARVQDALYAVKAASQEGIVPGGGATLYSISTLITVDSISANSDILYGATVLLNAIRRPMLQIIENVGEEVTEKDLDYIGSNFKAGYDAVNKTVVSDMFEEKIIDPAKVTRVALESAVSIASLLLTTECSIVDTEVYEPKNSMY